MRVLCAGHGNRDVTVRVGSLPAADAASVVRDRRASGGGSAANVAAALSDLGVRAPLLGSVGTDERGERVRRSVT